MKYLKCTLLLLLLVSGFSSEARRRYRGSYDGMLRRGVHIGVSGSINSVWILNQNNYSTLHAFDQPIVRQSEMDYVFTFGGQIGLEVGYNFRKKWGFQFEPSFSWAGQSYSDAFVGPVNSNRQRDPAFAFSTPSDDYGYVKVKRDIRFNYIQFPVYMKYQTHIGDIANYYIMLGPQLNIRQSASENVYVHDLLYTDFYRFTPDQKFVKVDFGMSLNTGVEIYAKQWMYFSLGLVSFASFTDLNGEGLKNIDWYSKNDVTYQSSHNFYIGIQGGLHFYLDRPTY